MEGTKKKRTNALERAACWQFYETRAAPKDCFSEWGGEEREGADHLVSALLVAAEEHIFSFAVL